MNRTKLVLDACCGSKMFWFEKETSFVLFQDNREIETRLCDGRKLEIKPDVLGDFRAMEYGDETFFLVVFDPPHLLRAGEESWLCKKYGKLSKETWREDISKGIRECFRVLKINGTMVFKWSEDQVSVSEVLSLFPQKPLFGHRRGKTVFLVFLKTSMEAVA